MLVDDVVSDDEEKMLGPPLCIAKKNWNWTRNRKQSVPVPVTVKGTERIIVPVPVPELERNFADN